MRRNLPVHVLIALKAFVHESGRTDSARLQRGGHSIQTSENSQRSRFHVPWTHIIPSGETAEWKNRSRSKIVGHGEGHKLLCKSTHELGRDTKLGSNDKHWTIDARRRMAALRGRKQQENCSPFHILL